MSVQAYIDPEAKVGNSTVIEPFAYIGSDVVIGEDCWIGAGAHISSGARIGNGVKIFPHAVISPVSQDLKYKGEYTTVEIGDNTVIREGVTVHRATLDRKVTKIGKNCLLMGYVHVAHDCWIGDNVIIANNTNIAGHCTIDDHVVIEGMVGVQQFVHIGAHSFVAGMSGVRKNVPPFVKAAREPLQFIGVNSIGLRRRGFTDQQIINIEDIYRTVYVQNSNIAAALKIVDLELPQSDEKIEILDFIRNSPNGIMRGIT